MGTKYEQDVVAWASEQVALLRAGKLSDIDVEHIAEEIEDVGRTERRELTSRMAVLLAHLLKWQFQPERRGASWTLTIKAQRKDVAFLLKEAPSLKSTMADPDWKDLVWQKAAAQATAETGLDVFPEDWAWTIDEALDESFLPD